LLGSPLSVLQGGGSNEFCQKIVMQIPNKIKSITYSAVKKRWPIFFAKNYVHKNFKACSEKAENY
jgi:hypothetical protein